MRQVATVAFLALLVFGKLSTLSSHGRMLAVDQAGDSGDDDGDDS